MSVTTPPTRTFCGDPALATGAAFAVVAVTVTVAGALLTLPSLTVKPATKLPAMSGVNVGVAVVAPARVAVLPTGLAVKVHE